jgi:hypothetical protein
MIRQNHVAAENRADRIKQTSTRHSRALSLIIGSLSKRNALVSEWK